ncbi:hypothetical protein BDV39DRAFT_157712 [Aspergillus sergii]|uniref:Uncharacterized protein n=1 Tax=Aspergillus sergii TaxID=1034303 RepID=A0A5N6XGR7_9EURO|nr:hypothetical protein BDV39DRAFT_157712 [Aspergillus sergii]
MYDNGSCDILIMFSRSPSFTICFSFLFKYKSYHAIRYRFAYPSTFFPCMSYPFLILFAPCMHKVSTSHFVLPIGLRSFAMSSSQRPEWNRLYSSFSFG